MSDQNPVLYKNWLKAGLGLLYTKHGIQKTVEDEIAAFHRKTYGNIGSHCKTCTTQNVLLCPTPGICGRRCNFHDNTDPQLQPINCPVNVCQDIRDEIIREHRYSLPSFKNTHAEKWYENPWEIAKCYMAATGYHDVQSADDTDFTGLVSVILNFEPFQHEVNADLTLKGNIFEKARDSRNSIMHNAKMELPTSDLPNHFLTLKSILSDGKRIQSSPEAQTALQKINDLENGLITITVEDEIKIREESLRSIENLRDKSLKELDRKTMECRDNLEQKIKEGRDTLEQKTTECRDTLEQKTTEGKDTLEKKTTEGTDTIEQKTTEGKDTLEKKTTEGKDTLEKKTTEGTDTLEQKTTEGRDTLEQKTTEGKDTLEQKTTEGRDTLEQKTTEGKDTLEQKTTEGKDTLEQKTKEGRDTLEQKTTEGRDTLEQKTKEGRDTLKQKTTEGKDTLEKKTTEGRDTLEQKTTEGKETLEQKTTEGKDTLEKKTAEGKDTLEKKTGAGTETLEQKTRDITETLEQKTREGRDTLEQKITEGRDTLEQKITEGRDTLEQKITEGRDTLEQKTREGKDTLEQLTIEGKDTLEQKTTEGRDTLEQMTTEGTDTLEQKTTEGRDTLEQKTTEDKDTLEKKTTEGRDTLEQKTTEGKDTLEQKTTEGRDTLEQKTTEGKDTLEQKAKEGRDTLEQKTTEGKDTLEKKTTEGKDTLEKKTGAGTETLEQKTRDITETLEKMTTEGKDTLEKMTTECTDTLEQKTTEGRDTLEQKITEGEDTLEQKTREGTDNLEKKTREAIQQGLDDLNAMTEKCTEKLHKRQAELDKRDSVAVDEADGEQNLGGHLDREYLEKKKNLERELIEFYLSRGVNSSPIPVLFDDEDVEVDYIFIMPQIMIAQHGEDSQDRDKINTISELFKNTRENGHFVRRVCIKGEAGYGKTFLCKKIVSSWCKVHSGIEPDKLAKVDIAFLKSFDLLFYLPLRNSHATTISELIKQLVVREGLHCTLHEILKRESEKCLIILDGLDEYSAAVGIPESDPREKYSIILTSRPWKIESLRPTQHSLGQEIELTSMENNDALIEAVVDRLNKKYGGQKDWTKFKYEILTEHFLDQNEKMHLAEIPVILIQMICMWYDGENIVNKRTDFYKEMLVYLFKLGEKRRPEICLLMKEQTTAPKLETKESKHYFQDMERLLGNKRVASIIFKLAELAFQAIFGNKKEDMLIFSHSDMDIYTLSKEDIHICLSIGYLSQEKIHRKVTKREKVLSFVHKTFQEFFAALHIANGHKTVFKDMLQSVRSLDAIMEQREVFIFMIGFKPELLSELSKHIAEVVDSDQRILCYRNPAYHTNDRGFPCGYTLGRVQETILICIDECGESGAEYKVELHDVIVWDEEFKTRIQKLIPRLNCDNIKSLLAGVFMGDLLKNINMKQIVKLQLVVRSQEEIDLLAKMMGSRSVLNLAALILDGRSRLTASIKNVLDELVNANQLTNLEFRDFNLSHDEILYMCNMFSRWRQLEVISLGYIMCQTCKAGQCKYSINLSNNARLRDVSLFHIAGDVLLGRNLPIERIQIRSLKHGNIVIQQLKDLKTLEELSVCGDTFTYFEQTMSFVSAVLTEVIPTLHNRKFFTLYGVDLEDEDLSISCQTREMLILLMDVRMTLKCLKTLVESILQSPCRIEVQMWAVDIKPEQNSDAALQLIRDSCNVIWYVKTNYQNTGFSFANKVFKVLNFQCNKAIHIGFSNISGDRYRD